MDDSFPLRAAATARARRVAALPRTLAAFAWLQVLSCIFPLAIFLILAASRHVHVPGLHRYDLVLVACLGVQTAMYLARLETRDELKVIGVFHLLGLALELYKTRMGSWAYPEAAWTKVGGVPLYSGFMYASVASYMCQAWRRMRLQLDGWPGSPAVAITAGAIYLNFFSHHYMPDLRWVLAALMAVLLLRARVRYHIGGESHRMPIVLAMALIGVCVWVAENVATRLGAWQYPNQASGWHPVHPGKISSWSLLAIISFIVVAQLKHVKYDVRPRVQVRRRGRRARRGVRRARAGRHVSAGHPGKR